MTEAAANVTRGFMFVGSYNATTYKLAHLTYNGLYLANGWFRSYGNTGWVNDIANGTKAAITPMDWAAMLLICFVLPAVLSVIFCEIERKLGWIKEGDLKLN